MAGTFAAALVQDHEQTHSLIHYQKQFNMKPVTSRLASIATPVFFPLFFIWKKTKRGTIVVLLITVALLTSCYQHYYKTHTQTSTDEATLKRLQNSNKYFIIHFNDNKVFGLNNLSVTGDKMEGDLVALPPEHNKYLHPETYKTNRVKRIDKPDALMEVHLYYPQAMTADQLHISIPLSGLSRMDVYEFDKKATTANHILSTVGIVVVGVSVIGLIAFAITCNCPQVYVNNNGQYEFKSGVYSGAIYSTLERSDYLPLDGISPVKDKYQFRIGNVENEEQFINQVQLMKVDHPADMKVLADRHGKILTYQYPATPVSATYDGINDVTQELKFPDAQYYSFDSKADENGFSSVIVSFKKPAEANKSKLLVLAGNSKWSGYLYKEFASLFGNSYEKWRKQQELTASSNAQQWQIDQGLPMKVFIETDKGWQYVDHFALTGNTASRDMIMEIDLANVKTDKVNIKIESSFQFWDMDMVAMDFSDDKTVTTTILDPVTVTKNDGTTNLEELLQQDKKYTHLAGNDFVNIEFNASANDNNTSLFLVSSGYYHSQPKYGDKVDMPALLQFKEKGAFDRFSRNKYSAIQESLAKMLVKPGKQ
jgi:hypothetical protein